MRGVQFKLMITEQKSLLSSSFHLVISILCLFAFPFFAYSQNDIVEENSLQEGESVEDVLYNESIVPPNTVSCFDYYSFGSVQADVTTPIASVVSGAPIAFTGTLINKNPYPIVDGSLYVKILRARGDRKDANGPDVVDQFFVQGDIAIPANGSVPISFQWNVPAFAANGDYQLATFFTTSRKTNLLGLSFTDDVVGNTVPFTVSSEQFDGLWIDKSTVTVGGSAYYFAAFPPQFDAKAPVEVRAHLENTVGIPQRATVSWSVYQWDAQLRENVVQEEVQQITVPAEGIDLSYSVTNTLYPVYYVVATVSWNDSKSIIGVRFVREGIDRMRMNFPGVTSFPLKAGESATLFSCLHNSGSAIVVPDGSLDLTLTDRAGNIIHEYRYDGAVTGAMMGVASNFTPERDHDFFTLNARLYQGGEYVDEATLVYDCQAIDSRLCYSIEEPSIATMLAKFLYEIVAVIGMLAVLLIIIVAYRKISKGGAEGTI